MKKFATSIFLVPSVTMAFSLSGNFKTYPMLKDFVQYSETRKSLSNSAKIQISETLPKEIKFELAYELTTITEKQLPHVTSEPAYRYKDLIFYIHDEKASNKHTTTISQNLNRFNFNFTTAFGDVSIGRMPLAFGVSKSISPNDVLTPIAISTIDKEERTGVDTVVLKTPLTSTLMMDVGFVAGKELKKDKNAYYLRPKLTVEKLDLSVNLMNFKEKKLVGFEVQHPIEDAGFWFDYAFVDNNRNQLKDFSRLTTGVDYKFQSSLYLAFEYHYNGSSLETSTIYPEDFLYVRDYHYMILTSSYEITPLLLSSFQLYQNPKDKSAFTTLKFDYNLTDNSYLSLGTYQGLGNQTTSEFGRYGKIYFTSFRYYF